MLLSDQEIAQKDLNRSLKKLAKKYNISVSHLYSIISNWIKTLKTFLKDPLMPEVRIDNFIVFVPRPYKIKRDIKKLWSVYRLGRGSNRTPKDPKTVAEIKLHIKILKRLSLEKTGKIDESYLQRTHTTKK